MKNKKQIDIILIEKFLEIVESLKEQEKEVKELVPNGESSLIPDTISMLTSCLEHDLNEIFDILDYRSEKR